MESFRVIKGHKQNQSASGSWPHMGNREGETSGEGFVLAQVLRRVDTKTGSEMPELYWQWEESKLEEVERALR